MLFEFGCAFPVVVVLRRNCVRFADECPACAFSSFCVVFINVPLFRLHVAADVRSQALLVTDVGQSNPLLLVVEVNAS
uniref:Secreted protein n=1 Tax=Panagrellus redivivus TaxID=6233 RepID=A0A7E4VU55_PANRE